MGQFKQFLEEGSSIEAAAKEIHDDLFSKAIGSATDMNNYMGVVMKKHKLSDKQRAEVITAVKKLGYKGNLLEALEDESLEEAVLKFNAEDYSGKKITVQVDEKRGTFKSSDGYEGTFKITDGGNSADVFVDGVEFFAYKDKKSSEWSCSDMGITREGDHPVEAALKVAANVI